MTVELPQAAMLKRTGESRRRVAVIGAGLGGLAAALRLQAAGLEVQVLEACATPGGRAGQIQADGYTFDTGPSLITMPELLDELFRLAGTTTREQLTLHRLDPFYRIHWHSDPRWFDFNGDPDAMAEQIGKFSPADARRYPDFIKASRRIHHEAILAAGRMPFLSLGDLIGLVPKMVRLDALRSVDRFVGRFFKEPHVRQAFSFHPLFIGGDPFRVPAVYAALAYLQIESGVWYSDGGVHSLVKALTALVERGGRIAYGDPAVEILQIGGRVRGVRTSSGEVHPADFVVSNADVLETQRLLLRESPAREPTLTMSCFLLYLGTDRRFPQLAHHTLLVGEDFRGFIGDVTQNGRLGASPSLYVHAPARTERAMAPLGGDSLSVLLPVPNLRSSTDWHQAETKVRQQVIEAMESPSGLGMGGLRQSVTLERRWTPLDFRRQLRAASGNAFGPEPTLLQSAYFRQPNKDRRVQGLFHVGAGTHPGAGIPGVLLGAEITSGLLLEEVGAWRR